MRLFCTLYYWLTTKRIKNLYQLLDILPTGTIASVTLIPEIGIDEDYLPLLGNRTEYNLVVTIERTNGFRNTYTEKVTSGLSSRIFIDEVDSDMKSRVVLINYTQEYKEIIREDYPVTVSIRDCMGNEMSDEAISNMILEAKIAGLLP